VSVLGKTSAEIKSKVFNIVLLRDLHTIYMDWRARCASCSERHMDRLSLISLHSPSFSQDWRETCNLWEAVAGSQSVATAVSSAKVAVMESSEVGRSAV
jgi:hypothetical protein